MHDLRHVYTAGGMEVKVSDPVVSFCETVVETSALKVRYMCDNTCVIIHV